MGMTDRQLEAAVGQLFQELRTALEADGGKSKLPRSRGLLGDIVDI
jgi:hypothetical protein